MSVDADRMAGYCIKASVCVAALTTIFAWPQWFLIAFTWVMVYPLAIVFSLVLGFVLRAAGAKTHGAVWMMSDGEGIVERSPEIVGLWRGAKIHEWIVLDAPNVGHVKLLYQRCVDLANEEFDPPDEVWFMLIDGGVLYVQPKAEVS